MIEQEVFRVEWAVLCERFGKDPSRVLAARYYQALSPRMNTQEFKAACQAVFMSREFFPRPNDFLDAVAADPAAQAAEDWILCDRVMRGEPHVLGRMSEAGRKTVALMGGPERLRLTPVDEVHFRRAEFMRLHEDAQEIHRREKRVALPFSTPEAQRIVAGAVPRLMGGTEEGDEDGT